MKVNKKMLSLAILASGFSASCFAQSTATASTTATLVVPISIVKVFDLNFGTVASSSTAGTVVIDFASNRTVTGGVTLPAGSLAQKTAQFAVTGQLTGNFSIAVTGSPITLTGSVAGTITAGTFLVDAGTTSTLVLGTKTINVGGTLVVPADTVAGVYTNANGLFVTVNYD